MNEAIRVLLVDNELSFCEDMSAFLGAKGFHVDTATSGPEAVERVHACRGAYDVAVIDQVMGPPNGIEIMLEIRQLYTAIEVLILTAWGNMEPGERAMELGAYRYMSKPIVAEELAFNIRTAARLSREQRRRLALEALVRAGHRIGTAHSEGSLHEMLHEEAFNLLPGLSAFLISSFDEETGVVTFPYACRGDTRLNLPARQDGNSITEFVLRNAKPLLLPFGDATFRQKHGLDPPFSELGYCTSEIAAPMFVEGRVTGAISALSFEPNVHFTQEHLQALQAFANQAAVEIRNVLQWVEAEQLRNASEALAGIRGRDAVLHAIVEQAHWLIDSDFTGLVLQDEDGLLQRVPPAMPSDYFDRFEEPRQKGGVTREVSETRQPRVIHDTRLDPLVKESVRLAGIRSMLAFPLIYGERVLGVLYAHAFSLRYFTSHDVNLWSTFATQAAAALHTALEDEREVQDFKRLADALGTLTERLDLKETMLRVATAAKTVFEADTCRLAYVDPPTGQIVDWVWAEGDPEEFCYESEPRRDGLTNYALGAQEPVFRSADATHEEPRPHPELVSKGLQSVASLPLRYGGRPIGVLHCNYLTRKQPFDAHLKTLFEAFRVRAAMALDRARREQISEIWNGFGRQVATCTDLRTLYRLFADHAWRALRADFAVFYPYDPTTALDRPMPLEEDCVCIGELRTPWRQPEGGLGGGVHEELEQNADGLLIINDLEQQHRKFHSRLTEREQVRAFVALRLEVIPSGREQSRLAGMLFVDFRQPVAFEDSDCIELRQASSLTAASILRLNLRSDLERALESRNLQLRAVFDITRAFERESAGLSMDLIAKRLAEALDIHACTLLEYEQERGRFIRRGISGLRHPDTHYTLPPEFEARYMRTREPTVIADVQQDELMRDSDYINREGIKSAIVFPLKVETEPLGLLFASYRESREFNIKEREAMGLFAELVALVLHEARLGDELDQTRRKLARRLILVWVSMIEASWRHSLVQKAAAIRNYAAILQKRLAQSTMLPQAMEGIPAIIGDIDRLATEIASAPPRVPQSWEMEAELLPLASLLEEVAERESKPSPSRSGGPVEIRAEVGKLGGVQVRGYRRWLIYTLEALLQNAQSAMPKGGEVIIAGTREGSWAEIRIQDSGSGVPKGIQSKLFKELIPKKEDVAGMGIGSLLAATIVEEHGGSIALERPGPGDTTVLIRLPLPGMAET